MRSEYYKNTLSMSFDLDFLFGIKYEEEKER